MEYEGKDIPREICEALAHRVGLLDSTTTLEYAAKFKIKSVRHIPDNAAKIQDILKQRVLKCGRVSREMEKFLADVVLITGIFGVLSVKAITTFASDWLGLFGVADTLGCWLFDTRDEIRGLALRRIPLPPAKKVPSAEIARKHITRNFRGFLKELQPLVKDRPQAASPKNSQANPLPPDAVFGQELRELREKAGKLRGLEKKLEKCNEQRTVAKNSLREQMDEIRALREQQRLWEKANCSLEETLRQERKERATRVRDEVSRRMEAEENRWLRELNRKFAATQSRNTAPELLARVDDALRHQAEIDTLCGNRRMLEDELRELEKAREKIRQARLTAINPLRELSALEEELENRTRQINSVLNQQSLLSVPRDFLDRIEAADTAADFRDCRDKLKVAVEAGFVDEEARQAIEAYLYERQLLRHIKHHKARKLAPADLHGIERLLAEIENNEPFKVWLDGHNVINGLAYFRELSETGHSHQYLRDTLVNLLRPVAARNTKGEWVLIFDGANPSSEYGAENFRISFSGGGNKKHKADMVIVSEVESDFSQASALSRYVFSDDNEIRQKTGKLHATPLHIHDLELLLNL